MLLFLLLLEPGFVLVLPDFRIIAIAIVNAEIDRGFAYRAVKSLDVSSGRNELAV